MKLKPLVAVVASFQSYEAWTRLSFAFFAAPYCIPGKEQDKEETEQGWSLRTTGESVLKQATKGILKKNIVLFIYLAGLGRTCSM